MMIPSAVVVVTAPKGSGGQPALVNEWDHDQFNYLVRLSKRN